MEALANNLVNSQPLVIRQILLSAESFGVNTLGLPSGTTIFVVIAGFIFLVVTTVQTIASTFKKQGRKAHTVLLLGPCNAGKTVMFHKLTAGTFPDTVTSMKEATRSGNLYSEEGDASVRKPVTLIDFPGHQRLRL